MTDPAISPVPDPDNRPEVVSNRCLCDWDIRPLPNRVSKIMPGCPLHGELAESMEAALRRVEQERDHWIKQHDKVVGVCIKRGNERDELRTEVERLVDLGGKAMRERDEARSQRNDVMDRAARLKAELDAERDKRAEDIAAYERACGLAVVAERERDEALAKARVADALRREMYEALYSATWQRDSAKAELASARTELDAVRTARDTLDRELAETIKVRNALAGQLSEGMRQGMWIVARDGGRNCERCEQEIRRGEAYELLPGADELAHIHCPHRTKEPTDG